MESLPVQPGDIVLIWFPIANAPIISWDAYNHDLYRYGAIFADLRPHYTSAGYHIIADRIFDELMVQGLLQEGDASDPQTQGSTHLSSLPMSAEHIAELEVYQSQLRRLYADKFSIGAIVMNCNPFTLGHQYLIEQAASQCNQLIVFVVEEDHSVFSFADRIELVRRGTIKYNNVTVMPSGRFMISSLAFTDYFSKASLQDRAIDPSLDVQLFAKAIAPCLHITKRFVGEEPFDTVTAQYNLEMKQMLPKFGIQVIELPRKTDDENIAISASRVRKHIEQGDFDKVKPLVPKNTYRYLVDRQKQQGGK